jgi:hypothetical protein
MLSNSMKIIIPYCPIYTNTHYGLPLLIGIASKLRALF